MTYKGKTVRVILTGDAKEEFQQLKKTVSEEQKNNIGSSDHQTLLRSINQKLDILKTNPEYGTHIEKRKIPKEYITRYDVTNLWKLNLSKAWRLIYTIRGNNVEIISLVLDIIDHPTYEKKFRYRKG